jgi:D-alanine-D-alanine ligase
MRIVLLYNAVSQQDTIEDLDVLVQVEVVSESLKRLGHELFSLACTLDLHSMKEKLRELRPDRIFNLVEALHGDDSLVFLPPAVFDILNLPYTGAPAESLFLTTHKLLAKDRLSRAGLPTPRWIARIDSAGPHPNPLPTNLRSVPGEGTDLSHFPKGEGTDLNHRAKDEENILQWIIKGVWEQGSRDMDDDAVFTGDVPEVQRRLRQRVKNTNRPAFAEQYIEGREFNLAMLTGPGQVEVLPPAEVDFSAFPERKPRIVGYRAKWQADSFEYNNTPHRFDFPPADRPLLDELRRLARQCWNLFMLRGWGRVDFRVDQSGRPWILEVNANPCLSPDAGFAAALQQAGITFDQAIERILHEVN